MCTGSICWSAECVQIRPLGPLGKVYRTAVQCTCMWLEVQYQAERQGRGTAEQNGDTVQYHHQQPAARKVASKLHSIHSLIDWRGIVCRGGTVCVNILRMIQEKDGA